MEINIFNIARRLPNPIKKPLSWLYNKWNTKIDEEIIGSLEEYFDLNRKEVMRLLKLGDQLNADLWRCLNPKTEKEIKKFYEDTPFYVFHLALWHSTRYQRMLRSKIIELSKGKILDYGGGMGDLSVKLAKKGFSVDYVDLPGRTFNFAKWFFQKNKCNVKMINLKKKKISKKYDTILCIDVIEHVLTPKELLKDFANHVRINGRLIITALHPDISEEMPMHFEIKFDPEKYLNSLGMIKTEEPFLWIKKKNLKFA